VNETLTIPARFNGPLDSGNGGYCAGLVAGCLGGRAEVSLRAPVPLDTRLDVVADGNSSVRVLDGDVLVAEGSGVGDVDAEVPEPVSLADARLASGSYRGLSGGLFSRCFVCGRDREDTFGVFAGAVEGRDVVASPWTPPAWTAAGDGRVSDEIVWAVLDCPTYFALYHDREELPMSFLARMSARVQAPVLAGEEHVVIGWPIELDGRKHHAGSAVLSAGGEVLAVSRALLIAARDS
jgi:hypothetical protein